MSEKRETFILRLVGCILGVPIGMALGFGLQGVLIGFTVTLAWAILSLR